MEALSVALSLIFGLVLVASLLTDWLRRHWISEPLLALGLGVAIGPAGLGWLDLSEYGAQRQLLEQTATLTLALVLVSVGSQLPRRYAVERWRSLTLLTFGSMLLMWLASSLLLKGLLALEWLPALILGAVVTPLDPVLAAGVTSGEIPERNVPERLRQLLSFESAASHGFGYLLVLLPVLLLTDRAGNPWLEWLVHVLLWDGAVAMVVGAAVGYGVGRAQSWSLERGFTSRGLLNVTFVALSLALVAAVELMGSNGLLAVVVAGFAYARVRRGERDGAGLEGEARHYEATFKKLLQVPVFVLLGLALPWGGWAELGWAGAALVAAVLLLRRIPALLLLKRRVPQIASWGEALFLGWFGPIGVGALHFALLAVEHTQLEPVWVVGSLLIVASTVAHDLTSTPFMRWLRRGSEQPQGQG